MASRFRSGRRRASTSPGSSSTSPGRKSSGHRNVRRRASTSPVSASSTPAPAAARASSTPTPTPTPAPAAARASSSPGQSSSTPTPRRASSTPTPRRASSTPTSRRVSSTPTHARASSLLRSSLIWKKPHMKLTRRRTGQALQKVLKVQHGRSQLYSWAEQLPDELYELFVSEKEEKKSSEFRDFYTSEAAVTAIDVPGQTSGEQYLRFSDPAKISSATLIDWVFMLGDAGYSLRGCFDSSDFAVTHFGYFKGKRSLMKILKKYKVKWGRMDMEAAADLILDEICSGAAILPSDLQHLLGLLKQFKKKNTFIIRHHASLYNELGKDVLFSSMFVRFKKLEKLNKSKYKKVLAKIPYCSGLDWWKPRVRENTYLEAVLDRKNPTNLSKKNRRNRKVKIAFRVRSAYKGHGGELLRFRRNGQQHLPDFSIGKQPAAAAGTLGRRLQQPSPTASSMKKKLPCSAASAASRGQKAVQPGMGSCAVSGMVEVELYGPDDAEHMFEVAVPDLLVDFQQAMSDVGEIKGLGWPEPSRGGRLR